MRRRKPTPTHEAEREFGIFLRRLGQTIKQYRSDRGRTQRWLAGRIGSHKSSGFISQIENGKSAPSLANLRDIAAGLGVKLEKLLSDAVGASIVAPDAQSVMRKLEALSTDDRIIALDMVSALVKGAWNRRKKSPRAARASVQRGV